MKTDIIEYCRTCDVCQKVKTPNFTKFRFLIPNPIPSWPYQSISMDFIINMLWSNGYNAIFIVVDHLSKQGSFIPCTMGLSAKEFGELLCVTLPVDLASQTEILDGHWIFGGV